MEASAASQDFEVWDTGLLPLAPGLDSLMVSGRRPTGCYRARPADELDWVTWLLDNGQQHPSGKQLRLYSLESGEPLYVRFVNTTSYTVRMLWLDYKGNEVAYEIIRPGEAVCQHTFLTHPWIVREVTTGTRLLLDQQEAFVPCELPPPVQPPAAAAAVATAQMAAAGAAVAAADAPAGQPAEDQAEQQQSEEEEEEQPAEGLEEEEDVVEEAQAAEGGAAAIAAGVAAAVILAAVGAAAPAAPAAAAAWPAVIDGLPVHTCHITELPSLKWSKDTHKLFLDPFKAAVRAFLLCHQQLQRTDSGSNSSNLGHLHHHLLPHVVSLAAPRTPQAVHFEASHRPDVRPALIKEDCWASA